MHTPAVSGGRVYFGSDDYKMYCLDAASGALIWNYTTGAIMMSSPAVSGGCVYIADSNGKVYAFGSTTVGLNLRTVDSSGNALPSCNVTVIGVGSKTSGSTGWANFTNVSPGTYLVTTRWQGNTVNQTSITLSTSSVTMNLKCRVYRVDFTNKFRDAQGNPVSVDSFRLICPNGTTTEALSIGSYYLQNGTFQITNIIWQGGSVTSFSPSTFDPYTGLSAVTLSPSTSTTISCQLSTTSISTISIISGNGLTVSGAISPAVSAQVTIQISKDGGATWSDLANIASAADGTYSYTWVPQTAPWVSETYTVRAAWSGNIQYLGATSLSTTLMVSAQTFQILWAIGFMVLVAAVIVAVARRRKR